VFSDLKARWDWRPIPNCPGRFVFSEGPSNISPEELALSPIHVTEHIVATAKDPVLVAIFGDGGLISYRKQNGTYLHTLNSRDGLERKLQQLGIAARLRCLPAKRRLMRSSTDA
jgi:hypothetical protein